MDSQRKTELLAPAKDLQAARVAIDYGADAIYMGGPGFGARHAAVNSTQDIAQAVEYARRYGVRVYCTLNTILFDNELEQAHRQALEVIEAGVDALIIQDMAYMEMGLEGVEMHASTQMFNSSPRRVRFLQQAGFSRVILERNLTLQQIRAIREATTVELEAFVHGAICVCHSGRCYMSLTMDPSRSGNRGRCSQPCRLTYDLVEVGQAESPGRQTDRGGESAAETLIRGKHLLSVQDLDLSERLGELLDAGATSFKIEGRLKDYGYVKNTVAFYRRRLDREIALRQGLRRASSGNTAPGFTPDLSKTFTRGRSEYFFGGKRPGVASPNTPKAVGEYLGKVISTGSGWLETDSGKSISAGDGICFLADGELTGTNVNRVDGRRIYTHRRLNPQPGTALYRNYDHNFQASIDSDRARRTVDASAAVTIESDRIRLSFTDEDGISVEVSHRGKFDPASNPEKARQTIRTQISKSGDTIFRITDIAIGHSDETDRFVPASTLNALRREGLKELLEARLCVPPQRHIAPRDPAARYPDSSVPAEENVTNRLARQFYLRHGATDIEPGMDTLADLHGMVVMRTPYCIRRETGRCTGRRAGKNGQDILLRRGSHSYRLRFDCEECLMEVVFEDRF